MTAQFQVGDRVCSRLSGGIGQVTKLGPDDESVQVLWERGGPPLIAPVKPLKLVGPEDEAYGIFLRIADDLPFSWSAASRAKEAVTRLSFAFGQFIPESTISGWFDRYVEEDRRRESR